MVAAKAYYAVGWRVFPESGLFARTSEEDLIAQFFQSEAELRRYETEFDQIQDPDTPTDPKQRESVRYPEGAAEEAAYLRSVNVDPRVHEAIYELYAAGFEEVPRDPTS